MTKAMGASGQLLMPAPRGATIPRMKSTTDRILKEALRLPEDSRAELAGHLLDSLEPEKLEPGWEEAWTAEIERRIHEIDSGKAMLIRWSQVRRNLLRSRRDPKRHNVSR